MAFSPDNRSLVTVGADGCVRRIVVDSKETSRKVVDLPNSSNFRHSGIEPVVVFAGAPVRFHETKTGVPIKRHSFVHYPAAADISDRTLIATRSEGYLGIWKLATGELIHRFDCGKDALIPGEFSPDNSLLLVSSIDQGSNRLDLIDLRKGALVPFSDPEISPQWAYFCNDNGLVAWLPLPERVICWNVRDRTVRWQSKPSELRCTLASVSPDRNSLITSDGQDIAHN